MIYPIRGGALITYIYPEFLLFQKHAIHWPEITGVLFEKRFPQRKFFRDLQYKMYKDII